MTLPCQLLHCKIWIEPLPFDTAYNFRGSFKIFDFGHVKHYTWYTKKSRHSALYDMKKNNHFLLRVRLMQHRMLHWNMALGRLQWLFLRFLASWFDLFVIIWYRGQILFFWFCWFDILFVDDLHFSDSLMLSSIHM